MKRIGAWCQYITSKSVDDYVALANAGKLNDLYLLMYNPTDPKAVADCTENFYLYFNALSPLGVDFYAWIWCGEDPTADARAGNRLLRDYPIDGIVANAERAYSGDGFKRSQTFLAMLNDLPKGRLGVSTESTPAFRLTFDYRSWELAGANYLPQCYWHEFPHATPEHMVKQAYLPDIVHVGWNYRLWIRGANPRWGLVLDLYTDHVLIRDLKTRVVYETPSTIDANGSIVLGDRVLRTKGEPNAGKILGFFPRGRILPVVGTYGARPSAAAIQKEIAKAKVAKASLYLGEGSTNADFAALSTGLV